MQTSPEGSWQPGAALQCSSTAPACWNCSLCLRPGDTQQPPKRQCGLLSVRQCCPQVQSRDAVGFGRTPLRRDFERRSFRGGHGDSSDCGWRAGRCDVSDQEPQKLSGALRLFKSRLRGFVSFVFKSYSKKKGLISGGKHWTQSAYEY